MPLACENSSVPKSAARLLRQLCCVLLRWFRPRLFVLAGDGNYGSHEMARFASRRRGRLIFALDATMSRQPTWDAACRLQSDMFAEAAAISGLDVQLVYYRGLSECRASRFVSQPQHLAELMTGIACGRHG